MNPIPHLPVYGGFEMNFSDALINLKNQKQLSRSAWNANGQFVMYQKGYPNGIAINKNTAEATGIPEGTTCRFSPYLMLLNAEGVFVPWVPSMGDLLAEDWYIIN